MCSWAFLDTGDGNIADFFILFISKAIFLMFSYYDNSQTKFVKLFSTILKPFLTTYRQHISPKSRSEGGKKEKNLETTHNHSKSWFLKGLGFCMLWIFDRMLLASSYNQRILSFRFSKYHKKNLTYLLHWLLIIVPLPHAARNLFLNKPCSLSVHAWLRIRQLWRITWSVSMLKFSRVFKNPFSG